MEKTTEMQRKNKGHDNIKPYMWKKGQSGNVMGRPKGKTMKDYVRQYLERMTDEERDAWLEGLPKETIWTMAEGNAHSTSDNKVEVTLPQPILGYVQSNNSPTKDNSTQ